MSSELELVVRAKAAKAVTPNQQKGGAQASR